MLRATLWSLALSVACLRGLGRSGYILQVDRVFGPRAGALDLNFATPVDALERGLTLGLGGEWSGRAYVLVLLTLCSLAPMFLFRGRGWAAQGFAGLFGALNGWTYERAAEGQWAVAAGAAMLFVWLDSWERFRRDESRRSVVGLGLASALPVVFDAHMVGPVLLLFCGALAATRSEPPPRRNARVLLALGIAAVILSYGVVGFFAGGGPSTYANVRTFGLADFRNFHASAGQAGLVAGLVSLQGFWAQGLGRWAAPWFAFPLGLLGSAAILGLVAHGASVCVRRRWLLVVGSIGLLVSASTAIPGGAEGAAWLSARVPLVAAYREPQKWLALWMLATVVLSAESLAEMAGALSRYRAQPLLRVTVFASAVASVLVAGGLVALSEVPRLTAPVAYPAGWAGASGYLASHVGAGARVAVLPWQTYLVLPFTGGRLVANPGQVYFPGNLLLPDDAGVPGSIPPSAIAAASRRLPAGGCDLATAIAAAGARWAVVEDAPGAVDASDALGRCGWNGAYSGAGARVIQAP